MTGNSPSLTHKSRHATGGADALIPADIGAASVAQLSGYLRSTGQSIFSIGDSISVNGTLLSSGFADTKSGAIVFGNLSWLGWALPQTSGRFRFGGLSATFGYTTAQILATHLPNAVASDSAYVVVLGGANDNNGSIPVTDTIANLTAMYTAIVTAGKVPILCTIPPQDANASGAGLTFITKLNAWIKRYALVQKFPLADFHSALVNPATNTYVTGLSSDGVHPTSAGARGMGDVLAVALNAIPANPHRGSVLSAAYNPDFILPDSCMTSTGSDKWNGAGSTTGLYLQGVLGADPAFHGSAVILGRGTGSDYSWIGPTTTAKWVTGNRVRVAALFDVPAMPASGSFLIGLFDSTASAMILGYAGNDRALTTGGVFVTDGVIAGGSLNVVTSASKLFRPSHVGMVITAVTVGFAAAIPSGTTIIGVSPDGSQAYMSANGTAGTALGVYVVSRYLTTVWEFTVPAAIVGHTIDFRYAAQGVAGTAIAAAQVSVVDLTALGAA